MSAQVVALIVFACTFGGALLGMALRRALPEHHLGADSKDVVKVTMGLVGTMSALVLGLLVASAKSSYDAQGAEVTQLAANAVLLDRVLSHYGPESKDARDALRVGVTGFVERISPSGASQSAPLGAPSTHNEVILDRIQALTPKDDRQHELQQQALKMGMEIAQTRWLMYAQGVGSPSRPLVVAIVFWLTIIFVSWGLFAQPNGTVFAALAVAALAVSGALFLIMEMYSPYEGLVRISGEPLRAALTLLGQ
jgi:hypothetical protein